MSSIGKGSVAPLIVVLAVAAACAAPVRVDPAVTSAEVAAAGVDSQVPGDTVDTAVVRVRQFAQSSTVTVVAWGTSDPRYGLRAMLRRDGSLIRDHNLYISTGYAPVTSGSGILIAPRDYVQTVAPAGHALRYNGVFRDNHPCQGGEGCSPTEAFSARVPDELLRSGLDSLTVRLAARGGTDATITVPGEVIGAFLTTVDSVSSALRGR